MKIKRNQVYWLREGLKIGAQDHMLETIRTARESRRVLGIALKRETDAYDFGYVTAFKSSYAILYRQDRDLLAYALKVKDVTPVDWYLYRNFDGSYHIEELVV